MAPSWIRNQFLPPCLLLALGLSLMVWQNSGTQKLTSELSPPRETVDTVIKSGLAKMQNGDNIGAVQDLTTAIAIEPSAMAYFHRSNAKQKLKDYKGAIDDLTVVINTTQDVPGPYYNRGLAKTRLEDFKGAIEDYTSAITVNPRFDRGLVARGNAYLQLDQLEKAIGDYDQAIQINVRNRGAFVGRGIAKKLLGNLDEACADYRTAADLGSKKAAGWLKNKC
ncbi:MAG: tetratricopeptide repeat protein [Synechococcus sp.]